MNKEIENKIRVINEQQPEYEDLQKLFQDRTKVFEKAKKDLARKLSSTCLKYSVVLKEYD